MTLLAAATAVAGVAAIGVAAVHQEGAPQPRDLAAYQGPKAPAPVGPALPPPTASKPASIVIPAIGVSSQVFEVGLTAAGALDVPAPGAHFDQAAWYRGSPAPGSVGPAVIVGHVDSASNGPSVFFRLGALRPQDLVQVRREDGSIAVFAVDSVGSYPKTAFPTSLVYGSTSYPALRLITCGGRFDRRTGHYERNIIVLAHWVRHNLARNNLARNNLVRNIDSRALVVATST